MIKKFKHKGLERSFESDQTTGVKQQHVGRLRRILALLETSESAEDVDLPGLNFHNLKGKRKGPQAVRVSGNWRVTFKIKDGDVFDVNYEDYH